MIDYEKVAELFQTESFQSEASNCKTMEDFQRLFVKNGFDFSMNETVELISRIAIESKKAEGIELTEEDLEDAAGGIILTGTAAILACVAIGVACIPAFAISAYNGYHAVRWMNKGK